MACLEEMVKDFRDNCSILENQDARGGGMTEDTPVWICAFANNQHNLKAEITSDPTDSAFAKAMKIAEFRVISILDVNNQVYSRLWCMYELYLTLLLSKKQNKDGLLAIYTYHEHKHKDSRDNSIQKSVVRLVDGGPTSLDSGYYESLEHFPKERFFKSLSISILDAKASEDDDRKSILNALVGRSGNDEPLPDHKNYDSLNIAVRGAFAYTEIGLKLAYDDGRKEHWNEAVRAMGRLKTITCIISNP